MKDGKEIIQAATQMCSEFEAMRKRAIDGDPMPLNWFNWQPYIRLRFLLGLPDAEQYRGKTNET